MVRSLWTAATGMTAQQTNLDTIANNLANVNTTGYKSEQTQFKSLLYQNLQTKSTTSDGSEKPVGIQVGLGVRYSAIASQFTQGTINSTEGDYDFAIEGDGFFCVQMPDGTTAYTRNGSLNLGIGTDGNWQLSTSDGYQILGTDGNPIEFPADYDMTQIDFSELGEIMYNGEVINQFQLAQFNNPAGLEKLGGTLFKATAASGDARLENSDAALQTSRVVNGYLEASNVDVATEMVNMIITQRAYELNSKAITASDTMLQEANNLRS
jgi:flagellar basal-body rod protein FlgG